MHFSMTALQTIIEEALDELARPDRPEPELHPSDLAHAPELPSRRWLLEAAA
jgi:hypothetical protein